MAKDNKHATDELSTRGTATKIDGVEELDDDALATVTGGLVYSIYDYNTHERVWRGCGSSNAHSWLDNHQDGRYAVSVLGYDNDEVDGFFMRDNVAAARDWDSVCWSGGKRNKPTWL